MPVHNRVVVQQLCDRTPKNLKEVRVEQNRDCTRLAAPLFALEVLKDCLADTYF